MSSELFIKFSEELKAVRESKNISLQQISNKTRINLKFLEAIEEGNFEIIDEVYVRAFIREYSQMIDYDGVEALKRYDMCKAGLSKMPELSSDLQPKSNVDPDGKKNIADEPEQIGSKLEHSKKNSIPKKEELGDKAKPEKKVNPILKLKKSISKKSESKSDGPKQPADQPFPFHEIMRIINSIKGNTLMVSVIAASALVVFIIIYFVFIRDSKPQLITERPYEEIVKEQSQKYDDASSTNEIANTRTDLDSLTLKITAADTSWIQVVMDDSKVKEFILLPSRNKSLKAKRNFDILLGNSGGIELFLNEKSLNFVGKRGGVRNIIVDKNGYRPATINEPARNE